MTRGARSTLRTRRSCRCMAVRRTCSEWKSQSTSDCLAMTARRWSVSADEGGDAGTDRMAYSAAALRAVGAGYEPADRWLGGARRGRDVVRDVGLADAGRPSRGEPAWLCGGSVDGRA